jgi:hypothetical protein
MKREMNLRGLRDVKGIHSAGIRSIPKVQRSAFLDLYMLSREKDRLEHEMRALDKRRNTISKQFERISGRMQALHQEIRPIRNPDLVHSDAPVSRKPKVMAVKY